MDDRTPETSAPRPNHQDLDAGERILGVDRRTFVKVVTAAAAALGLPASAALEIAEAAAGAPRPSVIWLHFQECTGCTESLLRTSHPDVAELILGLISLDYHETLMVPSGKGAHASLEAAIAANAGRYVLIVEGAIPRKDGGVYCKIGGKTAIELLETVAAKAGAVIALGSCASFGGLPAAPPNPTDAVGANEILKGKTVVTLPGCPANPYILLGTVLQYVALGKLPELDGKARPKFAYGKVIHEHCPRRGHFDAGRFATQFGDAGHRQGWCLYKLGCKGPATYASCSTLHFGEVVDAWPIGIGHPCVGCTEQDLAFRVPLHETVSISAATPPSFYPAIAPAHGKVTPVATGLAGLVGGGLLGAGLKFARSLDADAAPPPDDAK